jgi:hypothetical protein
MTNNREFAGFSWPSLLGRGYRRELQAIKIMGYTEQPVGDLARKKTQHRQ